MQGSHGWEQVVCATNKDQNTDDGISYCCSYDIRGTNAVKGANSSAGDETEKLFRLATRRAKGEH